MAPPAETSMGREHAGSAALAAYRSPYATAQDESSDPPPRRSQEGAARDSEQREVAAHLRSLDAKLLDDVPCTPPRPPLLRTLSSVDVVGHAHRARPRVGDLASEIELTVGCAGRRELAKPFRLSEELVEESVLLCFFRGGWGTPVELAAWRAMQCLAMHNVSTKVVAVSPYGVRHARAHATLLGLSLLILSDRSEAAAAAYGVAVGGAGDAGASLGGMRSPTVTSPGSSLFGRRASEDAGAGPLSSTSLMPSLFLVDQTGHVAWASEPGPDADSPPRSGADSGNSEDFESDRDWVVVKPGGINRLAVAANEAIETLVASSPTQRLAAPPTLQPPSPAAQGRPAGLVRCPSSTGLVGMMARRPLMPPAGPRLSRASSNDSMIVEDMPAEPCLDRRRVCNRTMFAWDRHNDDESAAAAAAAPRAMKRSPSGEIAWSPTADRDE